MLEPKDIAKVRKGMGLTQVELAKISGVSQSLIAKIESNVLDPSYSNMKKISSALNDYSTNKEHSAKDFLTRKIISVKPKETIKNIAEIMKKNKISQILVIDRHLVGIVTESGVIESIIDDEIKYAEDIMIPPPPVIDITTPESVIIDLLKFYQLVVVKERNGICGVITKSNLLEIAQNKTKNN